MKLSWWISPRSLDNSLRQYPRESFGTFEEAGSLIGDSVGLWGERLGTGPTACCVAWKWKRQLLDLTGGVIYRFLCPLFWLICVCFTQSIKYNWHHWALLFLGWQQLMPVEKNAGWKVLLVKDGERFRPALWQFFRLQQH